MQAVPELVEIVKELEKRRALNPLLFATRHKVQQDIVEDQRPVVGAIGGNWSGKTQIASQIAAGILAHTYPIIGMYPNEPARLWYVSNPSVFAAVQPRIRDYMPQGWIKSSIRESQWGCDKYWVMQDGGFIRFISWGMDPDDIEGAEIWNVIFDEPPPSVIERKVLSRIRGRWYTRKYYFFTPLEAIGDLFDNDIDSEQVGIHNMPIWCNCTCLAGLSEDKLHRLHKDVGLAREVHPEGCTCNGGYKTQTEIKNYIGQFYGWELQAREWGDRLHTHRLFFPMYDEKIHVFKSQDKWSTGVPKEGTVYVTCDPHDALCDFIQFWCVTPDGMIYLLRESPSFIDGIWKGIEFENTKMEDIQIVTDRIVKELIRIGLPFGDANMDPHFGSKTYRDSRDTVVNRFNTSLVQSCMKFNYNERKGIPAFRLVAPETDGGSEIVTGHKWLRSMLECDASKPIDKGNSPKIMISEECYHTRKAIRNYRKAENNEKEVDKMGVNEKPELRWKHAIDAIRYLQPLNPQYTWINPNPQVFQPHGMAI